MSKNKTAPRVKTASALDELLRIVEKQSQEGGSGVPGKDTKPASTDTPPVDQNSIGADKLKPQGYAVKTDDKVPGTKTPVNKSAAEQEDILRKVAAFELGQKFAIAMGLAPAEKQASQVKVAGRRDFEVLIQGAFEELSKTAGAADTAEAERAGAAFYEDYALKTAALDEAIVALDKLAAENAQLLKAAAELASIKTLVAEKQAAEAESTKTEKLASTITELVMKKLDEAKHK